MKFTKDQEIDAGKHSEKFYIKISESSQYQGEHNVTQLCKEYKGKIR